MAKTVTRVHLLAKELGVQSKAIIDKCQAEGLDIKNHMSTIGAGLAATIREWFSEGEHITTVETSSPVDLERVRVKRKKAQQAAQEAVAEGPTEAEPSADAMQQPGMLTTEQLTVQPGQVFTQAGSETFPQEAVRPEVVPVAAQASAFPVQPPVEAAGAVVQAGRAPEAVQAGTESLRKEPRKPPAARARPKKEPVVPAGPMLEKPKPAKLTGPQVVRIESIEPDEARQRRPRSGGTSRPPRQRYNEPMAQPLIPEGINLVIGSKGRKDGKDRPKGRQKVVEEESEIVRSRAKTRKMKGRDLEERQARLAAARGETSRLRPVRKIETTHTAEVTQVERPEKVTISEPITIKSLASALIVKMSDIVMKLAQEGKMITANQTIPVEVAELIAMEIGTELVVERKQLLVEQIAARFEARQRKHLEKRPPIVTVLGHVDHGKTSLLDKIRLTKVAAGEAGGITQHIGAYQAEFKGKKVTFLDTPGHEAFTAMRARGANMTDIAVLVVAADDGVMPQTIEAINHAKAAGVEIIVALNKIDLPGIDINRIYGQLSEYGLAPAEWGGKTEVVKTSATTGQGIEDLIEHLDYIAELKDYKADNSLPATGWVVDAKMTTTQGPVATLLVKEGSLSRGDIILAGCGYGRVRAIKDSSGRSIRSAESSMPVEIAGLDDVPAAGDRFFCVDDINMAKEATEEYRAASRRRSLVQRSRVTLDNLFSQIEAGNIKELNLVVRADVQGSVDVLEKYLTGSNTSEVRVKILQAGVGGITEGDVVLAEASSAIVIGFNVVPDERVRAIAESKGVDIRLYNIIYRITEDLRAAMAGLLEPKIEEKHLGQVVVRQTFRVSGIGTVAGCFVNSGLVSKNARVRLIRDNVVIKDACTIESLKHFKDDAREVKTGLECGIKIADFDDIKINDVLEAYEFIEVARKL